MPSRLLTKAICLITLTPALLAGQSPSLLAFPSRVDSLAAAYVAKAPAASVSIAVMRGNESLLTRTYGLADRATTRRATPQTVYEIGSLTKQFTAAAVMRLVEQGKLGLDDDISRYVPSFPLQGHHVTVRHLLNHTSGIHNYTDEPEWRAHWAEDLSPDRIVALVARDTFDFAPGTAMHYSNTGYVLLGMVIEKVTGRSYADVLNDEFFKPFGLTRTRYCLRPPPDSNVAKGYSVHDGGIVPALYLSLTHPFAAGAVCSTAADMVRWESLFHQGRVLRPASYALMTAPATLTNGRHVNYGFGLSIISVEFPDGSSQRTFAHNGGINGFLSEQIYLPSDSLTVVILTNTDASPPDGIAIDILFAAHKAVHGGPPSAARRGRGNTVPRPSPPMCTSGWCSAHDPSMASDPRKIPRLRSG